MTMDSEYPLDEKTVLLDREGQGPAQGAVTDFASPPRFEHLEDRMIYTGGLPAGQHFNIGPNSLVDAAWDLLSQVAQLRASSRENLQTLNDRLSLGITAFETRALHQGADQSQVMSARYVLCSVIDEAVVTTAWGGAQRLVEDEPVEPLPQRNLRRRKVLPTVGAFISRPRQAPGDTGADVPVPVDGLRR